MHASKKLYLPLLVAAALALGCTDKKDGTDDGKPAVVAATVNGAELTADQVNHALERLPQLDEAQKRAASLRVLRNLVDQELLLQKALEQKLDSDPEVARALDVARRQILAEAYMSRKLGEPAEPSDAEVAAYYDAHPELFAKRKIYRLQEVSIQAPEDRQEAIRAELSTSRSLNDFVAWLKSQEIPAKTAQGVKPAEELPLDILPRMSEMPDGQAMVMKTSGGLLVIVLADSQLQPVPLEQARPAIARMLQKQSRQKAAEAELAALKAAAKIEYLGEFADAAKDPAAPADETAAPADAAKDATKDTAKEAPAPQ